MGVESARVENIFPSFFPQRRYDRRGYPQPLLHSDLGDRSGRTCAFSHGFNRAAFPSPPRPSQTPPPPVSGRWRGEISPLSPMYQCICSLSRFTAFELTMSS